MLALDSQCDTSKTTGNKDLIATFFTSASQMDASKKPDEAMAQR